MTPATVPDLRGKMFRTKRLMPDAEARDFLRNQKIAHVGTVDGNGWPYVVPLVYIYEGRDYLYLHTGAHQGACDSALVYTSVVVFGPAHSLSRSGKRKSGFSTDFWPSTATPPGVFEHGLRVSFGVYYFAVRLFGVRGYLTTESVDSLTVNHPV
jgi:hypothetical protein